MTYTHLHFCYRFLTFVPAIQEFCLFASIGLLVDFYLQMVFFATILSIDIRRLELSDLDRGHAYLHVQVSELVESNSIIILRYFILFCGVCGRVSHNAFYKAC